LSFELIWTNIGPSIKKGARTCIRQGPYEVFRNKTV